jgi:septum formation topological specificity factor MinE
MSEDREQVRVQVLVTDETEEKDAGLFSGLLSDFMDNISKYVESTPEEYRSALRIEITKDWMYHEQAIVSMEIYYDRPETDEELASRIEEEEHHKAQIEISHFARSRSYHNR